MAQSVHSAVVESIPLPNVQLLRIVNGFRLSDASCGSRTFTKDRMFRFAAPSLPVHWPTSCVLDEGTRYFTLLEIPSVTG